VALIGLSLLILGAWLIGLGGTWYYAIAGLGLIISGALLIAGRRLGLWIYALVFVGTVLWALAEVGLDGWKLMPRIVAPAVLGIWLGMPWVAGKLQPSAPGRRLVWSGLAGAVVCALAILAVVLLGVHVTDSRYLRLAPPGAAAAVPSDAQVADADWRWYGRTPAGDRFSPLAQITPQNVARLKPAWSFRTGDMPRPGETTAGREFNFEATPIKVGDSLYFCSPHRQVFALDPVSGKLRWKFDPHPNTKANIYLACRGVAYFQAPAGTPCPERIITTTADMRLVALDARTGRPCPGFGQGGFVSLSANLGPTPLGFHFITSQPMVINDRIILGGWIYDNQTEGEPSGVIRAFDPVTGALAWAWDMGRADPTSPLAPGEVYTRGTPNGWGTYTADPALNLVYVPIGNATPDYFGGHRRPFDDKYSSALVALDITSGKERWHFQTVHHDLWDFDLPIGPSLVDLPSPGGGVVPALVQTTKQGQLYLLDRRDGRPLAAVQEKPVVRGDIPGERYSPTQPMSVGMPSLTPARMTASDTWGVTPIDQLLCRIKFRQSKYVGLFTPPAEQGSIGYPAFDGVVDWYGATIDPDRKVLIANSSYIPFTYKLVPHEKAIAKDMIKPWNSWSQPFPQTKFTINPQYGTPFVAIIKPWLGKLAAPCNAPPWGLLTAIDLQSRKILWQRPIGTTAETGPLGVHLPVGLPTGIFNMGGNVVTRSGVIFMAATADQAFRAIDERTGKVLWSERLPAGGNATPMTYQGADGKQYVVIAAGGHGGLKTRPGDYVMAFALP
jgi:quinoprotein glucose dehydrogenase